MMFDQQPPHQQDKRGYTSVKRDEAELDIESGETLYPGLSLGENQLRWGFIRKVYGILSAQILLTTIVSVITVFYTPLNLLLRGNSPLLLFLVFLPFICTIPILNCSFYELIRVLLHGSYFFIFFYFFCSFDSVVEVSAKASS